jgi:hypothetical protein
VLLQNRFNLKAISYDRLEMSIGFQQKHPPERAPAGVLQFMNSAAIRE